MPKEIQQQQTVPEISGCPHIDINVHANMPAWMTACSKCSNGFYCNKLVNNQTNKLIELKFYVVNKSTESDMN